MKVFAAVLALLTIMSPTALAKGDTVKITIEGPAPTAPIEITDPAIRQFNIWSGPGTYVNGVEGKQGFIIDWANRLDVPPVGLHHYNVSFYTGCGLNDANACRSYVVFYDFDASAGQGFVYLPGRQEEFFRLNVSAIYRGPEYNGHWFRATTVWDNFMRPIIANEAPSVNTIIPPPSFYGLTLIGNTVVASVQVNDIGAVTHVQVLQGAPPFAEAAVQAISQWKFEPAHRDGHPVASEIGVLMMFRPPSLTNIGLGGPSLGFIPQPVPKADHPVLPMYVVDPEWPGVDRRVGNNPTYSTGTVQTGGLYISGVVVFELSIRDTGSIGAMRVVYDEPFTHDFAKEVVKQWDFTPAVKHGKPVASKTIVAISFVPLRSTHH
jgi:TonB family protein